MKKFIVLIFLTVLFFSCDNQSVKERNPTFYILGNTEDIADGTKVYLKVQESNTIIPLDTSYINNNSFQFKGAINKPEVYGIYIDSLKGSIGLFIQNDSVFIDVNKNKLSESNIKGSPLNDQYLSFIKKSNDILSKTKTLFPLFQKARTENDIDKIVDINQKINAIQQENTDFVLNYARENPDSYIAAFALQTLLKNKSVSKDTIASIYNSFTHEVKKGDFAIEILLNLESQEALENIHN